jgi:hypothetical protein
VTRYGNAALSRGNGVSVFKITRDSASDGILSISSSSEMK